jgi:hypothetical protein
VLRQSRRGRPALLLIFLLLCLADLDSIMFDWRPPLCAWHGRNRQPPHRCRYQAPICPILTNARMVRVLISSVVREATPAAAALPDRPDTALLELAAQRDRRRTGVPAPALGLCFAAVGGRNYFP